MLIDKVLKRADKRKWKLKPCPFCGHAHILDAYRQNRRYQLYCPDCDKFVYIRAASKLEAFQKWNERKG